MLLFVHPKKEVRNMTDEHIYMKPIPFPGYPAPFWIRNVCMIDEFIKGAKSYEVPEAYLPKATADLQARGATTRPVIFDPGIWGGNRGPHLHLGEKIFLLDEKQWKAFSDKLTAVFRSKLEHANVIPVQDMMALDDAISGI